MLGLAPIAVRQVPIPLTEVSCWISDEQVWLLGTVETEPIRETPPEISSGGEARPRLAFHDILRIDAGRSDGPAVEQKDVDPGNRTDHAAVRSRGPLSPVIPNASTSMAPLWFWQVAVSKL